MYFASYLCLIVIKTSYVLQILYSLKRGNFKVIYKRNFKSEIEGKVEREWNHNTSPPLFFCCDIDRFMICQLMKVKFTRGQVYNRKRKGSDIWSSSLMFVSPLLTMILLPLPPLLPPISLSLSLSLSPTYIYPNSHILHLVIIYARSKLRLRFKLINSTGNSDHVSNFGTSS